MEAYNGGWFLDIKCEHCECEERIHGNTGESQESFLNGLQGETCFDCGKTSRGEDDKEE